MTVQPSPLNSGLLHEDALESSTGSNPCGEIVVPPRPDWFKFKTKVNSKPQANLLGFQNDKDQLIRSDRSTLNTLWGMIMHPVKYLPQLSGLGISLLVHSIFLLILALLTFSTGGFQEGFITLISGDGGDDLAISRIDTSVAMEISATQMSETSLSMPVLESSTSADTNFEKKSVENIEASVFEQMESDSNPFTGAFAPPAGSKVVKKGSFAAYTVPNDPIPEQPYYVVILIKVPGKMEQYPVTDLSGNIHGTDGWEQPIVDPIFQRKNKHLEVKDHVAQLIVQVPGAYKLVKDKISIRSKILKENQRLEIEF